MTTPRLRPINLSEENLFDRLLDQESRRIKAAPHGMEMLQFRLDNRRRKQARRQRVAYMPHRLAQARAKRMSKEVGAPEHIGLVGAHVIAAAGSMLRRSKEARQLGSSGRATHQHRGSSRSR